MTHVGFESHLRFSMTFEIMFQLLQLERWPRILSNWAGVLWAPTRLFLNRNGKIRSKTAENFSTCFAPVPKRLMDGTRCQPILIWTCFSQSLIRWSRQASWRGCSANTLPSNPWRPRCWSPSSLSISTSPFWGLLSECFLQQCHLGWSTWDKQLSNNL